MIRKAVVTPPPQQQTLGAATPVTEDTPWVWSEGWVHAPSALTEADASELVCFVRAARQGERMVVLDLRQLRWVDRVAVQAIVDASDDASRDGCEMIVLTECPAIQLALG